VLSRASVPSNKKLEKILHSNYANHSKFFLITAAQHKMKKEILSGNEAIARGFVLAGGKFAAAYPGTPSTEVLEELCRVQGIHAEWSINEKVAFEAAIGGSMSGLRSMACMKHVGVNVAADTLMTASYTGVNAGLVLMAADDPGMFSSQNEQDTRHFARLAKVPCLEPSDSREAKDFTKLAFEISEDFDTPVILRTTTRISHSKSVVAASRAADVKPKALQKKIKKYVMLPAFARKRHVLIEERLVRLTEWAETAEINQVIGPVNWSGGGGTKPADRQPAGRLGIIASGAAFQYAREAFPEASILKLGMTWPIPERLIKKFAESVTKLAVVEELDPFIEDAVKAAGVRVDYGKNVLPSTGELSREIVYIGISGALSGALSGAVHGALPDAVSGAVSGVISGRRTKSPFPVPVPVSGLPSRPPTFCPGCSHRGLFIVLSKIKAFVSGDIGCYTLGALGPFNSIHSVICMGASIPMAHGISRGLKLQGIRKKPVAVIGDSTFLHSGITGIINLAYNGGDSIIVIMNNDTTGMTGGQEHPGTGRNAVGEPSPKVDIGELCRACGLRVREIDAFDIKGLEAVFREEMAAEGPVVLVSNQPCALRSRVPYKPLSIDADKCDGCRRCLKAGCIGLNLVTDAGRRYVSVDQMQCNGCGVCASLCRAGAFLSSPSLWTVKSFREAGL
jgi:indolepyruvate ferredoxin oxidoreductase alpha subunit